MSASVNVLSVQALADLKSALARFRSDAGEALAAAAQEIRRTLEWLAERQRSWQGEVRRRHEALRRAQDALSACLASGDREHPPS